MKQTELWSLLTQADAKFTVQEFGDYTGLQHEAAHELIKFRHWIEPYKIFISRAYEKRGDPENAHELGLAFDIIIYKDWKQSQPKPMHQWRMATHWPWMGVGIYTDWEHDGEKRIGLHLDILTQRRPVRWIRHKGVYYYQDLAGGFFHDITGENPDPITLQVIQNTGGMSYE